MNEIRAVTGKRDAVSCRGAKLFMLKNSLGFNRIAFTFNRKFGSAVKRNRSRRISREVYRHLRQSIKPGLDLVFLVYQGSESEDFSFRMAQFRELLNRARLLKDPPPPLVFGKNP